MHLVSSPNFLPQDQKGIKSDQRALQESSDTHRVRLTFLDLVYLFTGKFKRTYYFCFFLCLFCVWFLIKNISTLFLKEACLRYFSNFKFAKKSISPKWRIQICCTKATNCALHSAGQLHFEWIYFEAIELRLCFQLPVGVILTKHFTVKINMIFKDEDIRLKVIKLCNLYWPRPSKTCT